MHYLELKIKQNLRIIKWGLLALKNKSNRNKLHQIYVNRIRKVFWGNENSKVWFYVIRKQSQVEGHYSLILSFLGHLKLAQDMYCIPVIDMKCYYNELWQDKEKMSIENAWEYFYQQPGGYGVDNIQKSHHIILGNSLDVDYYPSYRRTFDNQAEIAIWHDVYKKYIHFNDRVATEISKISLTLNGKDRIMAVSIRRGIEWGHLIHNVGFKWHCDVPSCNNILNNVKKLMAEWKCDYIFLTIDDEEGLKLFQNEFSSKLIYIERERLKYFINGIPNPNAEISNILAEIKMEKEMKYLSEVYMMSNCEFFVGVRSSSSLAALIMRGKPYSKQFIYNDWGKLW